MAMTSRRSLYSASMQTYMCLLSYCNGVSMSSAVAVYVRQSQQKKMYTYLLASNKLQLFNCQKQQ